MTREKIDIPNSTAYVSYITPEVMTGIFASDDNKCETALVMNGEIMLILVGDFRKHVNQILSENMDYPIKAITELFIRMEKEWGSSWSKNSTLLGWLLNTGARLG